MDAQDQDYHSISIKLISTGRLGMSLNYKTVVMAATFGKTAQFWTKLTEAFIFKKSIKTCLLKMPTGSVGQEERF